MILMCTRNIRLIEIQNIYPWIWMRYDPLGGYGILILDKEINKKINKCDTLEKTYNYQICKNFYGLQEEYGGDYYQSIRQIK